MDAVFGPFELPFVQRGLIEVLLLSAGAGVLGCWIVLRGLSFYSHAVGTAAFPGLVLADGLGFAAPLGALAAAALFALVVAGLARRARLGADVTTALALTGMLALGVILASDVFRSGVGVDTLLFGSLLLVEPRDVFVAAAASVAAVIASLTLGRAWLVSGFDPSAAPSLGVRPGASDAVLLALIALVVTAALSALGALLVAALIVVPAATTRPWTTRMRSWQAATVVLVALEGTAGLWLSVKLNAPPGATIAVLTGVLFAASAVLRTWGARVRRTALATAAIVVLALAGGACGNDAQSGDVKVVATTTQVGDWVRALDGGEIDVHQILQPNSDPHAYEPRPADVEALAGADLIVRSGGDLDAWIEGAADDAGADAPILDLSQGLPHLRAGDGGNGIDPHWWHDPRNAEHAVARLASALERIAPGGAGPVRAAARRYVRSLRHLDRDTARCFARIPSHQRKLVTDHDAFAYFAARYGIEVVGTVIPARTTEAQPSAGDLTDLARTVKREQVRSVFPESSVNADLARTIARETGATADHELYGDTLGPKGSPGATYIGMERYDAARIADGISGGKVQCAGDAR